ncbi:MAG: response regulator [Lentisphaerae bacterium]|nr:response regulator [Lentisphaerota bacterium]
MRTKILIVDDEADGRQLIRILLERRFRECLILEAANGSDGLRVVAKEQPDLVLLDVKMPGMSGIEFLKQVRGDPETARAPVIVYTGYGELDRDRMDVLESGADGFLCKPFQPEELYAQVRAILRAQAFDFHLRTVVKEQEVLIQRLRRAEEDLLKANASAEQAHYAKSVLLAGMSHELRTPLNAVLGFSQVLEQCHFGPLNDKQREYILEIMAGGTHLLELIDVVLNIANIGTEHDTISLVPLPLSEALDGSMLMARDLCQRRGIELTLEIPPGIATRQVHVDIVKLKQIMHMLLTNAVKFTPGVGRISVSAALERSTLIVRVADSGIGIAPEHLEDIFSEFFQVESGRRDKTPGVGMGLALVRRLVRQHGGDVWAESDGKGCGSCFTFTLPQGAAAVRDAAPMELEA